MICFHSTTQEEKKLNATRIAESRAKHTKLLADALVLQIESKRAQLLSQGVDEEKLQDEISVLLMADLQEKQLTENNAVTNILGADKVSQGQTLPAQKRREIFATCFHIWKLEVNLFFFSGFIPEGSFLIHKGFVVSLNSIGL